MKREYYKPAIQERELRVASPITLIPAGEKEAELLSAIHAECFPNYWDHKAFTDFFSVPDTFARLASLGGEVAGMAVWRVAGEQADILTIAVRPAFRRRGVARRLLAEAVAESRKAGATTLFLDVEDGNAPALGLYETHGFSQISRRRLYYRQKDGTYTDALVMQKKIA